MCQVKAKPSYAYLFFCVCVHLFLIPNLTLILLLHFSCTKVSHLNNWSNPVSDGMRMASPPCSLFYFSHVVTHSCVSNVHRISSPQYYLIIPAHTVRHSQGRWCLLSFIFLKFSGFPTWKRNHGWREYFVAPRDLEGHCRTLQFVEQSWGWLIWTSKGGNEECVKYKQRYRVVSTS